MRRQWPKWWKSRFPWASRSTDKACTAKRWRNYERPTPYANDDVNIINHLGIAVVQAGNYTEAEPHLNRALAIPEKALGPDHPDTATNLNNLAELYRAQVQVCGGRAALHKRALAIREKAFSADHPVTATSLNGLAYLYELQGRYAEAAPLYKRALAIREKAFGADHPVTATSLNGLASLYDSQGKYAEAEPLYKRALAIREKALGADHPDTATSLNGLARLY